MEPYRQTYCRIDLDILDRNLQNLKDTLDGLPIMLVLKGDALGHGAPMLFRHFLGQGHTSFAVAACNEAMELRALDDKAEILIFGWTPDGLLPTAAENRLMPSICEYRQAKLLSELGLHAKIQIMVDTGMHRLGFPVTEEAADTVAAIAKLPSLEIAGVYSHLAQLDHEHDLLQKAEFDRFLALCEARGVTFPCRHLANGKNAMKYPELRYDLTRVGTIWEGFCSYAPEMVEAPMSLHSQVAQVRTLPAGAGFGYGLAGAADHERRIATLCFGYADGVPKSLDSGVGFVGIRGKKAPLVGGMCMDMCFADVTDIPDAQPGDTVDIYGGDGMDYYTARELTGIGLTDLQVKITRRVPRVYVENRKIVAVKELN